jgi:hypothetical protein
MSCPFNLVFQLSSIDPQGQDLLNFPFIFAINLNWVGWVFFLTRERIVGCFVQFIWREDWVDLYSGW